MTNVTQPRSGIPVGLVSIAGQMAEVELHPEFRRFFESIYNRIGGATGSGSNDFSLSQFEDAGTEETKWMLAAARDEFGQAPPDADMPADDAGQFVAQAAPWPDDASGELAALRAEVDALRQIVQALQQGSTP
ncbi:MAG: hypothetical protein WCP82_08455 [Alphaproteobacteria bacterium]